MADIKRSFNDIFLKLKKDKKTLLTVILGITGMLLVLLSELPMFSSEKDIPEGKNVTDFSYDLQRQVENLISEIEGAGKVSVMLTYDTSEERVWAKDTDERKDNGGNNDVSEKHIIIDTVQEESGLCVKVIYPKVRGVAVVCSGGKNPQVISEIKALISALFDIGSNKISIAPRAEEE